MKKTILISAKSVLPALLLSALLSGCGQTIATHDRPEDLPTSGKANMSIDESFRPLFESQVFVYENSYPDTKFTVAYEAEGDVIKDILKDSTTQVGVICRDLTDEEKKYMEAKGLPVNTMKIADDAVALIVNRENPDSSFTVDQVKAMLTGNDSTWKQLNAASPRGAINVVFDDNNSGNARYFSDKLLGGKPFPANCFALRSNPAVIDYVAAHPDAIGIIGVNWISDKDDSVCRAYREKVKVVSVKGSDSTGFVPPWQTYIGDKSYPFHREMWIVKVGQRTSLGTGFVSFVCNERGQLIILKSGLVPARQPERRIELKTY